MRPAALAQSGPRCLVVSDDEQVSDQLRRLRKCGEEGTSTLKRTKLQRQNPSGRQGTSLSAGIAIPPKQFEEAFGRLQLSPARRHSSSKDLEHFRQKRNGHPPGHNELDHHGTQGPHEAAPAGPD